MQNVDQKTKDIEEMAMMEWLGVLTRLWDAIGKPLDADRLEVYRRELGDVPFGLLEKAVSRVIRENTYSNVPPVGTIWAAVRKELGNPSDLEDAIRRWDERLLERCFVRFECVAVETEVM